MTSKILIAVIDVITLGVGSLSNPAVSGVIKEYALGLTAATVSAAVYEAADASGLPPAVINALTIGAGIVTVIIGNKVLFKNKAGKVLATKDLDELKNPRARGNEAPPLRRELDDYLDGVGEFYEDDVFGQYYEPWPEMDDYLDELARHSRVVDVGSVCKTSYGKSSNNFLNGESFKELSRDDAREVVSNLLDNGEINIDDLQNLVPEDVPNTFVATDTIKDGAKYEFTLADGQKVIIRWHEPDPVAASKYPGCVSGSRYTAEIKVGNKQLKANGGWSRNQAINDVHVPIKGK